MDNDPPHHPEQARTTTARRLLTNEQTATYLHEGVLVVDDFLSTIEVQHAMNGLSRTLYEACGTDTNDLMRTGGNLQKLSSTNGSGGVLDVFYDEWKLKIALNPTLFEWTRQLWKAGYCHDGESLNDLDHVEQYKWHPYGKFDPASDAEGFAYIDRICYRLPTRLAEELGDSQPVEEQPVEARTKKQNKKKRLLQRGLTPHLDCCPDTYDDPTNKAKWRPIQCFVSLTDNLQANTGGFEAAKGFHREFRDWARNRPYTEIRKKSKGHGGKTKKQREQDGDETPAEETVVSFPAPCMGEYTHIRPKEDANVMERIRHISVRAGSVVFFDNRIPHANAYRHDGDQPRCVVYCSFLPNVEINRRYAAEQIARWKRGLNPTDQWILSDDVNDDIDNAAAAAREKVEQRLQAMTMFERKLLGAELEAELY